MGGTMTRTASLAHYIYSQAPAQDQRTGQLLFNSLRHEVAEAVRGTVFDPFDKELDEQDIIQWLQNHIVYDEEGAMVQVFSDNTILWEEE